jgi:hypothetical protein
MMDEKRDEASRICVDRQGSLKQYDSVSKPLLTRESVCTFRTVGYSEARILTRSQRYMAQGKAPCPLQNDKRYIPVTDVSEGLFNVLANFATELASSPEAFDSRVAADLVKRPDYELLRGGIIEKDARSKFQLVALGLREPSLPGVLAYQLVFQSPSERIRCIMDVDFTPSGLRILALGRVQ